MAAVILRSPLVYSPHVGGNFAVLSQGGVKKTTYTSMGANRALCVGNLASAISTCLDHPNAPGNLSCGTGRCLPT